MSGVSKDWVLNALAGLRFPLPGQAYDYLKGVFERDAANNNSERQSLSPAVNELVKSIGLGDIVSLGFGGGEYDCCTVSKVNEDGTLNLFRPYVHTNDFSYTGGVICYIGIETVDHVNPNRVRLIRKGPPLK